MFTLWLDQCHDMRVTIALPTERGPQSHTFGELELDGLAAFRHGNTVCDDVEITYLGIILANAPPQVSV